MKRRPFTPLADAGTPASPPPVHSSKKKIPFVPPLRLPAVHDNDAPINDENKPVDAKVLESSRLTDAIDIEIYPESRLTSPSVQNPKVAYEAFWIDALRIHKNKFPPREQYNDTAIQEIADSIEKSGQRDAIHVIPHPEKPGSFIIGDGWTRVQAIRVRNLQDLKVKAIVHEELTEEEVAWLGYEENEQRTQHTDFDRAMFYKKWRDVGWTWEMLSKSTKIPVGTLYPYGNYDRLDPDLLDFAKRFPQKMSVNAVTQLNKIAEAKGRDFAVDLCKVFIENDHPFKWLKEKAQVACANPEKKQARKSSQVKFHRRYASGYFRQRSDGQVEIVGTIPQAKLEEFNAMMDKFLSPYFGYSVEEIDNNTSAVEGEEK